MAILSLATLLVSADRPDPNAFVWLFYLGFVLLVGGCCAYLSALFSFGGVARNFAALVAVGLYYVSDRERAGRGGLDLGTARMNGLPRTMPSLARSSPASR